MGPDGTLSSSDLAGILFPAVPAGIPSPVGPIGMYGMLSPSDSDSVVLVDPRGTLSLSGLVGIMVPDVSVELPSLIRRWGHCPCLTLTLLVLWARRGCCPHLFPIVPTGELSSVEAVPFPGERDPVITQLPAERLVGDCGDVVNRDVTGNSCWAVPGGIGKPTVVAMIGLDVMPMEEGVQLHGADKCAEWDIRDEFETIHGMPVYYGCDLCTSDESDWEDPYDIACAEYVVYNFDAIEGMELMVFERLKGPDDSVMMVSERTGSTPVRQTSSSYPRWDSDTVGVEPVVDIFNEMHDVPAATVSPKRRNCSETYGDVTALYYEGISVIRTVGRLRIVKGILARTGANLHFKMDTVLFHRIRTIRCRR